MNQWKESRRAGRNKNKQNITSHDFEKKILTLLNRGCCVWFDLKRELHTLRPGHVPPTQLMKVIFLLLLCLRTVVWVFLGWAGTFRTKISLRPMPTTTLLIPQTHSSHTCGVVNWRWKKSGSQKNMILRFLSTIEQLHHFSYISASLRSKRYEKNWAPGCAILDEIYWNLTRLEIVNACFVLCGACVLQIPADAIGLCC